MKYKDSCDEVLRGEEEFISDVVEYDESDNIFLEGEFSHYYMNSIGVPSRLDWAYF